jgi:hypothetical protein
MIKYNTLVCPGAGSRSRSRNFSIPAPAPAKSFGSGRLRLRNPGIGKKNCTITKILAVFYIFAAPPDFDIYTSNFYCFHLGPLGVDPKKFSSLQGLEDDFILSQLKLKIVKQQNLQDWLSKPGKSK